MKNHKTITEKTTRSPETVRFFNENLEKTDAVVHRFLTREWKRQSECIELIASENVASRAVLEAVGSVNNNKYAEGYPGRRYYGGCSNIDDIEALAISRACELFGCEFANVQPHSGSQANQSVFMSLMRPGDAFLGMDLRQGGHLTHGAKPNLSGKWFSPSFYGLDSKTGRIDYDEVERVAMEVKPKLIIAGASAYSRIIDFARFRETADKCGAKLMVDMAHIAGLVAAGEHPSPFPHAHVVTTTTHKTLRCARGGLVLTNDPEIAKKINSAIFPGLQGGPLEQQIAGKAVGFGEALQPHFRVYARATIDNARVLAESLIEQGLNVVSGGTDNHLVLLDLTPLSVTGADAEKALESIGVICNKNGIPNDPKPARVTSGVRLGAAAMTTRGFGRKEFIETADIIIACLRSLNQEDESTKQQELKERVKSLTKHFPCYETMP